jgi:hypothetical protein
MYTGFESINNYDISDLLPEEDKNTEDYLKAKIDDVIARLYISKHDMVEAYNYFAGRRTRYKNQWIFDMQGIENPYDVPFISLIRPRLNVLLGIQLDHPINYKVTTIGEDVYYEEEEEKKNYSLNKIFNDINQANVKILEQLPHMISGKDGKIIAPKSDIIDKALSHIKYAYSEDFTTTLSRLCGFVIDYYIYTKDLKFSILELFKHLLIAGEHYYQIKIVEKGRDPEIVIINPVHFFHSKTANTTEVNKANEAFYVKYMTKIEIMNTFGHNLDDIEREKLAHSINYLDTYAQSHINPDLYETDPSVFADDYGYLDNSNHYRRNLYKDYIPVYFVEWLANNEVEVEEEYERNGKLEIRKLKRFRLDRYEGVRIGGAGQIYFNMKKSDHVVRSVNDPYTCTLSFNGAAYSEINSKPYSMVNSLIPIQDQYDTNYYIRENLLARVHGGGVEMDLASIPTFLQPSEGDELGGVFAALNLMKNGVKLSDSSQPGVAQGGQFSGQYAANLNADTIQAFDYVLDRYDNVASEITGVNRQMLGQFQARDGVEVSKQALAQASVQVKEWYAVLDRTVGWLLRDLLNACRYSYNEGHRGQYLLGGKKTTFTISSQFKITDYNVVLEDGNKDFIGLQKLEQLAMTFVQNQMVGPKEIIHILKAKSLSEAEYYIQKSITEKEGKGASVEQLQSENQELQKQLEELQKQISEKDKLDVEMKLRDQARKDRELEMKENNMRYEQMMESRKVTIKDLEVGSKDEAMKRRDDIELKEVDSGGKGREVENIRI